MKRAFADVNLPSVVEYSKWVEKQEVDKLLITSEFPLIDPCNTLRIGSEMAGVKGKVTYSTSGYHFTLTEKPSVSYNARSVAPTVNDYNLKVMSFNAENFYMYGNTGNAETLRQHAKS